MAGKFQIRFRQVAISVPMIVVLIATISGCSLPIRVEDHARKTNEIAWQVHHEMILLNILRARDHEPMLFTSLNLIRGSVKYSAGTGTIAVPFGGDATNTYGINPTASIESNPTFDVSVLDNEEFYRGILKPISVETLQLYLTQGWPASLLYLLAIESYPGCVGSSECANSPDNPDQFEVFTQFMKQLIECDDDVECISIIKSDPSTTTVGPDALQNFNIFEALKAGYKVERDESTGLYDISKPGSLVLQGPKFGATKPTDEIIFLVVDGVLIPDEPIIEKAHLRSPHGMIYYLGESIRKDASLLRLESSDKPELVIKCGKELDEQRPVIAVTHRNEICGIPEKNARESLRTISFVSQLVGLSKSAENLPTTGAVQVIN